MGRWAGWGAGPSGASAAGGPSRFFLGAALVGCGAVAAMLAYEGRLLPAAIAGAAAVYFALRLFAGLGKGGR